MLDDAYYRAAIEYVESKLDGQITYHLFSDCKKRIKKLFQGKRYILHDDDAPADWVSLYLAKNVIQSNSSFCWTASLYDKQLSIQPGGGYNPKEELDVPF